MKKILFFMLLCVTALILFLFAYMLPTKKIPYVSINNHIFNLELAKTEKEREIGLAKYSNIQNDFGMLFVFEKSGNYSFWMKDMKFPIDIIFIRNGKIVAIFNNVPPPTSNSSQLPIYKPEKISDTVLEINAGLSKKYNFKENDAVNIVY